MPHPFSIKEIAHQAGLSTATIDRVVNKRSGVRRQTINRVFAAIKELETQEGHLSLSGRKMTIDILVEAPQPFLDTLQEAVGQELPTIQSAVFRARADMRARFPVDAMVAALGRALRQKSDGVILMAPDTPALRDEVARLVANGVPVITLATDMPASPRAFYAGLDNRQVGATAAWLVQHLAALDDTRRVLITKRNEHFRGEAEREEGFHAAMKSQRPDTETIVLAQGSDGTAFAEAVAKNLSQTPVAAIYSVGGGNGALLDALAARDVNRPIFIAHDLNHENRALLRAGRIEAILYHDLATDIRLACQAALSVHTRGKVPMPASGAAQRVVFPPMLDAFANP